MAQYRTPTEEEIQAAKDYVILRNEYADILADKIDAVLASAAMQIVTICYMYNVDARRFTISSAYDKAMMDEIAGVMDDAEDEIYDLIIEYSLRAVTDDESRNAILAWLVLLGKGRMTLKDTLNAYLNRFLADLEAAIAALRFTGTDLTAALSQIQTYLHNIYGMPEVLTALRSRLPFAATMINLGGVRKGSVGLSNNGSTNVVSMAKTTLQMAWMRAQGHDMKNKGAIGYIQKRGSTYNCDLCDSETGFHEGIDDILTKAYPHPHCMCYRVPVYEEQ